MHNILHLTEEEIAICAEALQNDTLDQIKPKIKMHLQECDHCWHEVSFLSEMISSDSEGSIPENENTLKIPLKKAKTKRTISISLFAGVAASLLILFALIKKDHFLPQHQANLKNEEFISQSKDNSNANLQLQNKLAFTPNKNLEKLATRFSDSNFRGNDDIHIITSSEYIVNINNPILLKWTNKKKQVLSFEIYNNKEILILKKKTNNNSNEITTIQEKGIYYWKLLNSDYDLLFCGKIIIR